MSDKNSWESFTSDVGGCLNYGCGIIAAIVAIVLSLIYVPWLPRGIWAVFAFTLHHAIYVAILCAAVVVYEIIWCIVDLIRNRE